MFVDERPIVRKKVTVVAGGHHGGAWKVAYADFVTAMMAFFLLLWLLGSTSESQRDALADYFSPRIPLSDESGGGQSIFSGDTVFASATKARDGAGGVDEVQTEGDETEQGPAIDETQAANRTVIDFLAPADAATQERLAAERAALEAERTALEAERAAFEEAKAAIDSLRDAGAAIALGEQDLFEGDAAAVDGAGPLSDETSEPADAADDPADAPEDPADAPEDPAAAIAAAAEALSGPVSAAQAEDRRAFDRIENAFDALKQAQEEIPILEHLTLRRTAEGITIEIAETDGESLFESGSAEPSPKMRALMDMIAPIIQAVANDVAIIGHTDAKPFSAASRYTNWELSADRANAARRILKDLGVDIGRFAKIAGAADRDPISEDPFAPENRRIGITLLRSSPAVGDE